MNALLVRFVAMVSTCILLPAGSAPAAEVSATFTSATTIPVTADGYTATGNTVNLALGFNPPVGTNLTVVKNTGLPFIQGTFDNLAQGQKVNLAFGGITYPFVADYFGGSGNDLVLEWGSTRLLAWGSNFYGSLGDNLKLGESLVPVPVDTARALNGNALIRLSQTMHSVGFGSGDSLIAWGRNESGQLGTGNTADNFMPFALALQGELAGKRVVSVGVGRNHTVALCSDGTLASWGGNTSGQLGDGTTTKRLAPVLVSRSGALAGKTVTTIAVGYYTNLALCSDGTLVRWGGSGNSSYSPVLVDRGGVLAGKTISSIALGGSQSYGDHSLVLCSDGTLVAWGSNSSGQVGDGTSYDRSEPVLVNQSGVLSGRTVTAIATGGTHCLALCSDGAVVAWGDGYYGQLGTGSTNRSSVPVLVNMSGVLAGKTITSLAAGSDFSLALCSDGTLASWGNNYTGKLGNNTTQNSNVPVWVNTGALAAGDRFQKVGAGIHGGFALVAIAPPPIVETVSVQNITDTTATLGAGVNANGTATTVSFEYGPSAAYGSTIEASPSSVTGSLTTTVNTSLSGLVSGTTYHYRVVASGAGGIVISEDRTFDTSDAASLTGLTLDTGVLVPSFDMRRTKYNLTVQSGTAAIRVTPQTLHPGTTVKVNGITTSQGAASTPVILEDGDTVVTVEVIGGGGISQTYEIVVTRLPSKIVFATAGTTGPVAEGFGLDGIAPQLLLGYAPQAGTMLTLLKTTGSAHVEGKFSNLVQWQPVNITYGGMTYTFVINYHGGDGNDVVLEWANRRLMAWGENMVGQLGDGSTTKSSLPVPVSDNLLSGKVMTVVDTGYRDSLVLCTDGTVAAWGSKSYGSIGDGTTDSRKTPIDISQYGVLADKTVIGVADGWYHGMAWCADGTLAGWGYNSYGQIGTGNTGNTSIPTRTDQSGVLAGKTIKSVACGVQHTLALSTDGTLAAWGGNTEGQLGFVNQGTTSQYPLPILTGNTGVLADKTITAIAAGYYSSMALCSDGTLVRWGNLSSSNVGAGYYPDYAIARPVRFSGVFAGKKITAISAGGNYGLILFADGSLAELGSSLTPVLVNPGGALAGRTVTSISSGQHGYHAICSDGSLVAWSSSGSVSSPPTLVSTSTLAPGERFMGVSSGHSHSLAITARPPPPVIQTVSATDVTDTGATLRGSVSPNNNTAAIFFEYGLTTSYGAKVAATPATVSGLAPAAASFVVTGLKPGTLYHYRLLVTSANGNATGEDMTFTTTETATLAGLTLSAGTLAPGFAETRFGYEAMVPFATASITVTPVATFPEATVSVNGTIVATGATSEPVALAAGPNTITTSVTSADGANTLNYIVTLTRLPGSYVFNSATTVPVTTSEVVLGGENATLSLNFVPLAGTRLIVINNTGSNPIQGTFGNLAQGQAIVLTYNGAPYTFVVNYYGGDGNDLALHWANTRLFAWGSNSKGQLGNNSTVSSPVPLPVDVSPLQGRTVLGIAADGSEDFFGKGGRNLVLCADGSLFQWGRDTAGNLETGNSLNANVPVAVNQSGILAGKLIKSIAVGNEHSLVLCSDGLMAAWGKNSQRQLGNASATNGASNPVWVDQTGVLAGKMITSVSAGGYFNVALCSDGTVAAWGSHNEGQLGTNTPSSGFTSKSSSPVLVDRTGVIAGKTVRAIAAGGWHALALCTDGTLAAWGYNAFGQLGNGTSINSSVPVLVNRNGVLANKTIVAISAGSRHSLALCSDGSIAAWGYGIALGNGGNSQSTSPVLVNSTGALFRKTVTAISAQGSQSSALCSDGSTVSWGENSSGELGNNSTTNSNVPVLVNTSALGTGERFISRSCGASHNLAVTAIPPPPFAMTLAATNLTGTGATLRGSVIPNNTATAIFFEYGLTTSYGAKVAATPATASGLAPVSASFVVTGLKPDTLYHYRMLVTSANGNATSEDMTFTTLSDNANLAGLTTSAGTPAPVFEKLKYNYFISVANSPDQISIMPISDHPGARVRIRGQNVASGTASEPLPLEVGSNTLTVFVTAEDGITTLTYTLVVTRLPAVLALDASGIPPITADGFFANNLQAMLLLDFRPSPGSTLRVVDNTNLAFIHGQFSNLAHGQRVWLTHDGVSYAFVANYHGGTGNDLVLQWAGTRVAAWGLNNYGQLGDGGNTQCLSPVEIDHTGILADQMIFAVSTGYLHSVALSSDGTLASWGYNVQGQLGNNALANSSVPVPVDTSGVLADKSVVAIASGSYHNIALCSDGTVAAWGFNNHGQLGDGTKTTARTPVRVKTDGILAGKQVVAIAAGAYQSYALCSDGMIAAWGYNDEGELGDGTTIRSLVPVAVDASGALAGRKVQSIAAGQYHTLALCTDGTVVSWGYNQRGQLGNSSTANSTTPVEMSEFGALAGKSVKAISAGSSHSLALCTDGTLAAWGLNSQSQLGVAGITQSTTPVSVATPDRPLAAIATGAHHNLLRFTDGGMAAWGGNSAGQLGSNNTQAGAVPVNVDTSALDHGGFIMFSASGCASSHNLAVFAIPVDAPAGLEAWRLEHFGEIGVPLAGDCEDWDGDGIPNVVEYAFGLDPRIHCDGILPQPQRMGDRYELRYNRSQRAPDIEYGAEWSPDLSPGSWRDVPDSGNGDEHVFSLPVNSSPRLFMRHRVRLR